MIREEISVSINGVVYFHFKTIKTIKWNSQWIYRRGIQCYNGIKISWSNNAMKGLVYYEKIYWVLGQLFISICCNKTKIVSCLSFYAFSGGVMNVLSHHHHSNLFHCTICFPKEFFQGKKRFNRSQHLDFMRQGYEYHIL